MKLPHLPWISGKSAKKPDSFRLLSRGLFALVLFSVGSLLWAEAGFDPSTVRPKGCNPSEQNCGYQPSSPAAMRAIPVAPSAEIRHRGLPSSTDLSPNMPPVGNQGQQASCVAWAVAYATKSYQEKV
ncbi:MAG: hypothetical protein KDK33_16595, partial [Leptospiraceae bacterium]|nr:hypothetical protein [Leptospiraceae bacterium]